MIKLKIKTGDTVRVIAGDHKGTEGKVVRVLREKNKAIVEGVNIISKHVKPSASNPQGGIVKKEAPIQISNLAIVDPKTGETTKVAIQKGENGKNVRVSKKSKQVL
ncbi:50S ribosomal protein L24 [Myroides marinus]|jgi:large subunit ribosomal protein L24|uniref:Large ribosomal subunit protein uL24 n=1 Tax=Myroides marinus TaxID=703342 RepID=A0A165QJR7_9FLAO|nr:50S ribosomal protein L24 [Myroides marinus]KZE75302.1 50S ribosomal protein L24 [Myroides marinus]MDM1348509.1 50S ribosomal protein L24 [Myroides marinus]MDM1349423.1 50S ribosomal protein L24 [Myroides marinus]MDM1355599.1 50S ribosomal protein L24 [Myroides marinus]MDM1356633.1 50S ribosomal protein L24 [Myroides marinus]